jgi:hypothetical protein
MLYCPPLSVLARMPGTAGNMIEAPGVSQLMAPIARGAATSYLLGRCTPMEGEYRDLGEQRARNSHC